MSPLSGYTPLLQSWHFNKGIIIIIIIIAYTIRVILNSTQHEIIESRLSRQNCHYQSKYGKSRRTCFWRFWALFKPFLKMWIVNKRNGEGVLSCKNDARARREIRIKPPNGDQSRRGSNCIWPQKEAIL